MGRSRQNEITWPGQSYLCACDEAVRSMISGLRVYIMVFQLSCTHFVHACLSCLHICLAACPERPFCTLVRTLHKCVCLIVHAGMQLCLADDCTPPSESSLSCWILLLACSRLSCLRAFHTRHACSWAVSLAHPTHPLTPSAFRAVLFNQLC